MKEIIIYEFQLKEIYEALRLTKKISNEMKPESVETAYDRVVNNAYMYAKNAMKDERDNIVRFGKNVRK